MSMTSRERFSNTIYFKEVDHPFRWEAPAFWPTTIKIWHQQGMPESINENNIESYFKMDRLEFMPIRSGWTGTPFSPPFKEKIIDSDEKYIIKIGEDGITIKQKKVESDTSMPQFLKFPVKNLKDFKQIKKRLDPKSIKRLPSNWNKLINKYANRDFPLGVFVCGSFGHPRNLMGDENLMYALYDDPQLITLIMENWLELYEGYFDLICRDIIPDFILIWEDMAYKNGSLISPIHFKTFMFPYLKKLISFVRNKGIDIVVVDSDGDIEELLPIFINAGINTIFPFEVQAGMDIIAVRKQYGRRFAIIGGIDKRSLVDKRKIKSELDIKMPYMLQNNGYIPSLDHSVPPNITFENFLFYVNLIRKY